MPYPENLLMEDSKWGPANEQRIFSNLISDKTDGFDIPNQYYNEGDHNFDTVVLHQPTNMCTGRAKDRFQNPWLILYAAYNIPESDQT